MGQDNEKPSTHGEASSVKYMDDALNAFPAGAITDYRMRFAMQLLVNGTLVADLWRAQGDHQHVDQAMLASALQGEEPLGMKYRSPAHIALDVAEDLVRLAEARGYIAPIPETSELSARQKKQAHRMGSFQVQQQVQANRDAMMENAGRVATPN